MIQPQPTQRTIDLFTQLGTTYSYCQSLRAWIADDKCELRHELAVKSVPWAIEEGIEESCLHCARFPDKKPKPTHKRCSGSIISCGQLFEATPENFYTHPYIHNSKDGLHSRCKSCDRKYIQYLRKRKKEGNNE